MARPNPDHANADERNYGLQKRASFTDRVVIVDMIGRIHSDIFFQDRYMLNEVSFVVRLMRNKDSFCQMSGEANSNYKVKLISVVLLVRKVHLSRRSFWHTLKPSILDFSSTHSSASSARPTLYRQETWTKSRETVYRTSPVEARNRMR